MTLFVLLSVNILAVAQSVSNREAIDYAREVLGTGSLTPVLTTENYCVVQATDGKGFAIISLSGGSGRRILGFSRTGEWNVEALPPALVEWLKRIDNKKGTINNYTSKRNAPRREQRSIAPLLTSHWHQGSPYNDLSPVITDGNVKTAAGCVAIAAAQITYYWRNYNPDSTLRDTPLYPYGAAPVTMSIPRGTPNDWNLMKDDYTGVVDSASRAAVARLCYVIGTTSYLSYASSTGGNINQAANAMYSQYRLLSQYVTKKTVNSQSDWENILLTDLAKGYPVMCSGTDGDGHAFVMDGYDSTTGLFHFNFGWGGSGDGYYPVDDSDVSMGGYSKDQAIVYDIHPNSTATGISQVTTADNPDDATTTVYDLSGRIVTGRPTPGIYIIRKSNGTSRKVYIK